MTNLQVLNLLKDDLDFMPNGNVALGGPEEIKKKKNEYIYLKKQFKLSQRQLAGAHPCLKMLYIVCMSAFSSTSSSSLLVSAFAPWSSKRSGVTLRHRSQIPLLHCCMPRGVWSARGKKEKTVSGSP